MGVLVGSHLVLVVQLLMIAERTLGGLVRPEKLEEMDEELTKVIEDFDRAVNVEALRVAKESSKQRCSQIGDSPNSIVSYRASPARPLASPAT